MKRLLSIVLAVALPGLLLAQTTVTGTVTDSQSGDPMVGANVYIDALSIGAAADADGNYRISIPGSMAQGQSVEIQAMYIGYKRGTATITLTPGGIITQNFALEVDVLGLEEVVVTALGMTREKKALGYAVQEVRGDDFTLVRESNLVNSLAGRVAGVQITASSGQVGASSRIVLRGTSSLGGNNQPLFVVDGIPISNWSAGSGAGGGIIDYGNAAADVNPHDIASVTVLKGPNAAAIYGSRASNGAIIITTKSAKTSGAGSKSSGIGVSYEMHRTATSALIYPDFQNKYGQGALAVFGDNLKESWDGEFKYVDGTGTGGGTNDGVDESWGPELDVGLKIEQFTSPVVNGVRTKTPWISHPDNVESFFETATNTSHSLAITGSGERTSFRLSLTNVDEVGMIPNTDQNRSTVSLNATAQVTPKFSASTSFSYIKTTNDNLVGNGYDAVNPLQQMTGWFGRQVDMEYLKNNWIDEGGAPINWNTNYHDNPYWTMYMNTNERQRDRLMGNFTLNYNLSQNTSITARVGTDLFTQDIKQVRAIGSQDWPDGGFNQNTRYRNEVNADVFMNTRLNLGPLSVSGLVGANYRRMDYRYQSVSVYGIIMPELYAVNNALGAPNTNLYIEQLEENSVYGSLTVGFGDFLYVDATARNDWSSTLPSANWSYFYPSLTTSLLFTEMIGIDPAFMFGKVRASWAKVGSSTNPYRLAGGYAAGNAFAGFGNVTFTNQMPEANLKPESTVSTEVGVDLRLFNNLINLDAAYYASVTSNQIINISVSGASGYNTKLLNAGEITNNGIELTLGLNPIRSKFIDWSINLNWAANENEVTELYISGTDTLKSYDLWGAWDVNFEARPGEPYGAIYGGAPAYNDEGRPIISTGGGIWGGTYEDGDPLTYLGNITPDWTGGLENRLRVGPVSLSALIDFRKGGDIFSVTYMWGVYAGILEESVTGTEGAKAVSADGDIRKEGVILPGVVDSGKKDTDGKIIWYENGVDTTVVANAAAHSWNHYYQPGMSVFDGSWVKLRNVSVSYELPRGLVQRFGLSRASISLEGKNLAIFFKNIPHIDPETGYSSGRVEGVEQNALPSAKTIGFNLRIAF